MSATPSSEDERAAEYDLNRPDDVLAIAQHFYNEWYNGGLSQLFANWYPADVELIPAGLSAIGAPAAATIVASAIAELGPRRQWRHLGHDALINPSSPLRKRLWDLDGKLGEHSDRLQELITQYELKLSESEDEQGEHGSR